MRKTLYERLDPEVKARLEANQLNYKFTIGSTIAALDSKSFWNEMTINELSNLMIFSDTWIELSAGEIMNGTEKIIKPENKII
jgi:hypothetical protein